MSADLFLVRIFDPRDTCILYTYDYICEFWHNHPCPLDCVYMTWSDKSATALRLPFPEFMTRLLKLRGQQHSDGKGQGSQREREERIRIFVLDMLFRVHSTRSRLGPSRGGPARIWWICGSGWAAWKRWVMCLHPAAWVSHKLWEYGKVMWSLIVWVMNFMNQSILKVAVWFVIF